MAGVIGNEAGGYATVNPTENYVGKAIQNVGDENFRYLQLQREDRAKKDALAKAKQDAADQEIQQDLEDNDKLNAVKITDSGINGIDSALYNGVDQQKKKFLEASYNYRKTGDRKYLVDRTVAMNNLNSIANIPKNYKDAIGVITKGVEEGTINRSELKKITALGSKVDNGYIVPKIENGTMTFDVFERDPKTGKLSGIAMNNIKGEELISQLTPQKKFDYVGHMEKIQGLAGNQTTIIKNGKKVTGFPNAEKFAEQKTQNLFMNRDLLDDVAQNYNIEEVDGEYTPEDKKIIHDKYYNDVLGGLNKGSEPDYEGARLAETKRQNRKPAASKFKPFKPLVQTITKGGKNVSLGMNIVDGQKLLVPTYPKGTSGSIKGAVLNNNGTYSFSIAERKDDTLNANGLKRKEKFEDDNPGEEYEPIDSDYKYSAAKPTIYTSGIHDNIIEEKVRGMLNPNTGDYFQSLDEYFETYDKYRPKTVGTRSKKTAKAAKPKKTIGGF